ncbi:MAG: hypothetical protein PHH16_03725 [Candidatus Gracilibacteria bacterium]|nr:hypothetical protein [Candidatus Gracilibacteria bacterium]
MNQVSPRIHLILALNVAEKLPFRTWCSQKDCQKKKDKVCPQLLVINNTPVWKYADLLGFFSQKHEFLNPCLSHITIGEEEGRKLSEYLVFFAKEHAFHEEASKLIKGKACLEPKFENA